VAVFPITPKEESMASYLLWVNAERTILVRWWPDNRLEVCTRADSDGIWGPPVPLKMEAV
jgi:hypothetical protein